MNGRPAVTRLHPMPVSKKNACPGIPGQAF